MEGLFWTEPLTKTQILDTELVAAGDSEELSLCTGCLELAAFFLMVMTAGKRSACGIEWSDGLQMPRSQPEHGLGSHQSTTPLTVSSQSQDHAAPHTPSSSSRGGHHAKMTTSPTRQPTRTYCVTAHIVACPHANR